mgnify:CR=1 FL=1
MSKPTTLTEFFDSPERWTQGAYAKNADGEPCNSLDDKAVCFCLLGAINYVYGDARSTQIVKKLKNADITINRVGPWNDSQDRTFDEIVDLCKRAGV